MNVKAEHPKILFDVYFTGRDDSLSNKKYQYLFVNSRPVNIPKWLSHCVYNAYKESIPHDKYPGFLIYITVDPSDIDVNIHPTKREVKFADEGGIYDLLYKTLKTALTSHMHPSINLNEDKPAIASRQTARKFPAFETSSPDLSLREPQKRYDIDKYANVYAKQEDFDASFDGDIKVLGQAFDTYIIVEHNGELFIFDQHAAAERVRYEIYLSQDGKHSIKLQQMLIPENFELSPSLSEVLKSHIGVFNELGINVEEFGDNHFRVSAYPALLGNVSIEPMIKKIIEDLEIEKNIELEKKRDKIIRGACRASIKAGDIVNSLEAKKLINDLFKCEHPFTCPHGRPTAYRISKDELEKFFKRK